LIRELIVEHLVELTVLPELAILTLATLSAASHMAHAH
jgi:hypothetical protein